MYTSGVIVVYCSYCVSVGFKYITTSASVFLFGYIYGGICMNMKKVSPHEKDFKISSIGNLCFVVLSF